MNTKVHTWKHSRKGLLTGTIVSATKDWVTIRLVGDHPHAWVSINNRAKETGRDGNQITVLRKFLTEVKP